MIEDITTITLPPAWIRQQTGQPRPDGPGGLIVLIILLGLVLLCMPFLASLCGP